MDYFLHFQSMETTYLHHLQITESWLSSAFSLDLQTKTVCSLYLHFLKIVANFKLVDFINYHSVATFGRIYFYAVADRATILWYCCQSYFLNSRLKESRYVMLSEKNKDQENVTRWSNEILQSQRFSSFHYHMFLEQPQTQCNF